MVAGSCWNTEGTSLAKNCGLNLSRNGGWASISGVPSGLSIRLVPVGIRPGDVLVRLGQQPVESPEQLKEMLTRLPDDQAVPVLLNREGRTYFVALRVGNGD